MHHDIRVATGPVATALGDLTGNLGLIRETVGTAVRGGAELIVLPELATCGYAFRDAAEARAACLHADDPRLRALGDGLPGGAVLVLGFGERSAQHADERLFSSAAVISAEGVLAVYRKTHLWGDEALVFASGDDPPPVVDTPLGRIGVAVCYDAEFPEVPRAIALGGADVLVLPVNWPTVPRPPGERPPEILLAMAAARASRLPVVIADRGGTDAHVERGVRWTGGSAVIGADGWIVGDEPRWGGAAPLVAQLDLAAGRDKRLGPSNDALADRRPELYGELLRR